MGVNNIELITKYSPKAWDTVYKAESVTSLLDADPALVRFEGAKTVKIGKFQSGGLQDYYRNNLGDSRVPVAPEGGDFMHSLGFGYQKTGMRLVWEEFTLKCDRAAAIPVEMFDNEESGEQLIGLGVTEFARTQIVPEIDAYTLSTVAGYTSAGLGNLVTGDVTSSDFKPLAALNAAFLYMDEHEIPAEDQIVFVSPKYMNSLRQTTEVTKFLGQTDYSKNVKFLITEYEGRKLVQVPPARFRTEIDLFGREGYGWKSGSKAINFLMVAKSAVMHVTKYEKNKIIGGEINLAAHGFDGYTIYARVYHDVFVADNKRIALYCHVSEAAAPAPKLDVMVSNGKVKSITVVPGDKLYFVGKTTDSTTTVGTTLTNFTEVRVGDAVESKDVLVAVDSNKKVVATYTVA